jgi:acyl-CoA thioesterase FadM
MDLGRTDIMIRSGLWRPILRNGRVPVVGAGQIRFRRELKPFQAFRMETRIVTWFHGQVVMEHRLISKAKDGVRSSTPSPSCEPVSMTARPRAS